MCNTILDFANFVEQVNIPSIAKGDLIVLNRYGHSGFSERLYPNFAVKAQNRHRHTFGNISWERLGSNAPTLCLGSMAVGASAHQPVEHFKNNSPNRYIRLTQVTGHTGTLYCMAEPSDSKVLLCLVIMPLNFVLKNEAKQNMLH